MSPLLSIVIVHWNTKKLLENCLTSIYNAMPSIGMEVFIIDNASTDGGSMMAREMFPDVRLIENRINIGFAKACNQGIQASSGEYILLLNPDTEIINGALNAQLEFLETNPVCAAVGPQLINIDGTYQQSCSPTPTLFREVWRLFHLDTLKPLSRYPLITWDREQPVKVDVIQGACLMLRGSALQQVGLLDENFFIYSEEVDLCYRLGQAGFGLYWVPSAKVIHHGGQSTQQIAPEMFLQLYKSKHQFFRKHFGQTTADIYRFILGIAALARIIVGQILSRIHTRYSDKYRTIVSRYTALLYTLPLL